MNSGTTSSQLICFTDLLATFADIFDADLAPSEGPDSFSFLPALEGIRNSDIPMRTSFVMQAGMVASTMTIRSGDWKLITGPGSGGFSQPKQFTPGANDPAGQLYNLAEDLGETNNLYAQYPDIVTRLKSELQQIVGSEAVK